MLAYGAGRGVRTLAAVGNTQVTDSRIAKIAKIARTDIFRHKLGTNWQLRIANPTSDEATSTYRGVRAGMDG